MIDVCALFIDLLRRMCAHIVLCLICVMFHTYKQPDFDNRIYSSVHVYGLLAKTRKPLPPAIVVSMPIHSPREVGVVIFQCVTVHERFCNDAVGLV